MRTSKRSVFIVFLSMILAGTWAVERAHGQPAAPTTLRARYGLEPPTTLHSAKTALLLVDFQEEFVHGKLPLPKARAAIEHAAQLAAWARRSGIWVVDVQNIVTRPGSPLFAPGSPSSAFVPELAPRIDDLVLVKSMAGAFSKTNLDAQLRARGIDTLIVAGLMTHLAVATTASDGMVLGYHVLVAADATATRALPGAPGGAAVDVATMQRAALATLADRVADVLPTASILALPTSGT